MSYEDAVILSRKRTSDIVRVKLLRLDRTVLCLGILLASLPILIITLVSKGNFAEYSLIVAVYTVILPILLTCFFNYKDKIEDLADEIHNIENKLEVYGYDKSFPKRKTSKN